MITITDLSPTTVRATLPPRIVDHIDFFGPVPTDPFRPIETQCWIWTGWVNSAGYGYTWWDGRDQPAHRVVHTLLTGEDLTGLDRDHLCRVVACVRPNHGEAVSHAENMARSSRHQTGCRRAGHDWSDPKNVRTRRNGRRYCAECDRQDMRARYAARKAGQC